MRRRARFDASLTELAKQLEPSTSDPEEWDDESVEDDRLRLIFTCCHPALPPEAQVAMTLREVCGLTTDEIARAFLTRPPTVAQRIVRAKAKIRDARIPYEVPAATDLPDRLEAVLRIVYLVFNEGYSASSGGSLTRHDLSSEAIRLGRLLVELLPEPEAVGLLARMVLHGARRGAIWCTITWRTRRGRISAGDWGERWRPEPPTNEPSASPSRSRSDDFSSDGWPSCLARLVERLSA